MGHIKTKIDCLVSLMDTHIGITNTSIQDCRKYDSLESTDSRTGNRTRNFCLTNHVLTRYTNKTNYL